MGLTKAFDFLVEREESWLSLERLTSDTAGDGVSAAGWRWSDLESVREGIVVDITARGTVNGGQGDLVVIVLLSSGQTPALRRAWCT